MLELNKRMAKEPVKFFLSFILFTLSWPKNHQQNCPQKINEKNEKKKKKSLTASKFNANGGRQPLNSLHEGGRSDLNKIQAWGAFHMNVHICGCRNFCGALFKMLRTPPSSPPSSFALWVVVEGKHRICCHLRQRFTPLNYSSFFLLNLFVKSAAL